MLGVIAPALALAAALSGGPVYAGWSQAGSPSPFVVLRLDASSARVREFAYHVVVPCGTRGRLLVNRSGAAVGAVSRGKVEVTLGYRMPVGGGLTARVRGAFAGRLDELSGDGTFTLRATVRRDGRRRPYARCATRRTWRMRRSPGRLFDGSSDQHEPMALELSDAPMPMVRLHLAWRASCPALPLWNGHDGFHRHAFPLNAHGGFAGTFEWPMGHGITRLADAEGTIASGETTGWAFVQQILAGEDGGSCDTGRLRWTAFTG